MPSLYEALSGLQSKLGEYFPGLRPQPMGEQLAQQELMQQGSIMARQPKSDFLRENPALDTLISPLLAALNAPLENVSGPGQAVLGPIRTKAQKQIAKAIFRGDPEVLQKLVTSKRKFEIDVPPIVRPKDPADFEKAIDRYRTIGNSYGVNIEHNPALNELLIHTRTTRGKSPDGQIYGSENVKTDPDLVATALHEALHGLTGATTRRVSDSRAGELIGLIKPHLNQSGKIAMQNMIGEIPQRQLGEALSYLGESARRGGSQDAASLYQSFKPHIFEIADRELSDYFKQQLIENVLKGSK